jgi:hypothetical protein
MKGFHIKQISTITLNSPAALKALQIISSDLFLSEKTWKEFICDTYLFKNGNKLKSRNLPIRRSNIWIITRDLLNIRSPYEYIMNGLLNIRYIISIDKSVYLNIISANDYFTCDLLNIRSVNEYFTSDYPNIRSTNM